MGDGAGRGWLATSVVNLTPPGVEPHDVELSPSDVETIRNAELVLYLGGGFQPALEDAVESRRRPPLDLLRRRQRIRTSGSTRSASRRPSSGSRELSAVPARRTTRLAELKELDREYRRGLAHCDRRVIVTTHAAFGHLAARYGLTAALARGALAGVRARARASSRS